jgi:serine/threonine protein kinase
MTVSVPPDRGKTRLDVTLELRGGDTTTVGEGGPVHTPPIAGSLPEHGATTQVHALLQRSELRHRLFGETGLFNERYQIVGRLGEGGSSVVYLARDEQAKRRVALKVLRIEAAEFSERMLREARSMSLLVHDNIVRLHEVERFAGQLCLVMDYIEGETLAGWLTEPRTFAEKATVFAAAARGVHFAHCKGIAHRDIKPQNVLVAFDGRVKVTDFGLAKVFDLAALSDTSSDLELAFVTTPGTVLGTPRYMSPEQFAARPCDARSDQFSFCVTLYEAFFGDTPFGGTQMNEIGARVLQGKVRAPNPPPSFPPKLVAAITRGLALDPGARHENMRPLIELLDELAESGTANAC